MEKIIYLDNSATTRPYDEVSEAVFEASKNMYGNPSSLHSLGLQAEKKVKDARHYLASAMGALDQEVIFTSCGTESDSTAIYGVAKAKKHDGKRIITTKVEHPAVLEPLKNLEEQGYEVIYLPVDKNCAVNPDDFRAALTRDTILVTVMAVNNEIGTVMPISEIASIKDSFNKENDTNIILHTDAVQAFGKIDVSLSTKFKGVDLMSVSGHKIHAPKGIGALYVRSGLNLPPFVLGGGQEKGRRSGTENTTGIIGLGLASKLTSERFKEATSSMAEVRSYLLNGIKAEIPDVVINSFEDAERCAPSVLSVTFMGTRGEVILHTLEQSGIFVSTGSACSSNHKGESHVLKAMGLSPKAIEGTLRFSFSEFNTTEEMQFVVDKLKEAVTRFRKLGTFR